MPSHNASSASSIAMHNTSSNNAVPKSSSPLARASKALLMSLLLAASVCSAGAFAAPAAAPASERVNINTADAATIDRVLVNVGPSKAEAIVAYRKANGVFRSAEQLALVKGIGLKTIEKNRDRIVVGNVGPAPKPAMAATATRPIATRPTSARPAARR